MALRQEMQCPALGSMAVAGPAAPPASGATVNPSPTQSTAPSPIHQPLHGTFPINLTDIFNAGNLSLFSSEKSNPENIFTNLCSFPKIFHSLKKEKQISTEHLH